MAEDLAMYAQVEIMGHRQRAGAISDATIGGKTLLRIEHPTRQDHTGVAPLCEYYSGDAIFAIRPCSRDEAIVIASWAWPEPTTRPALPSVAADFLDEDDEDDFDRDDEHDRDPLGIL